MVFSKNQTSPGTPGCGKSGASGSGVFSQPDGNSRAIILIKLLNQQVKASMPLRDLKLNAAAE